MAQRMVPGLDSFTLLAFPFCILSGYLMEEGGVVFGRFAATEASAFAIVYCLIPGIFLYREMKWRDLPGIIPKSAETTGIALLLIAASTRTAWMLAALVVTTAVPVISEGLPRLLGMMTGS